MSFRAVSGSNPMNRIRVAIIAALLVPTAHAAEPLPDNEIELAGYRGNPTLRAFFEYAVAEKVAVYLSATDAKKDFEEIAIGPAYYVTPEMEIGLSVGVARYAAADREAESHRVVSMFGYLKNAQVEAEATGSRYGHDPEPWYYRVYVQAPFADRWSAGLYGEQDIGWGPRISWAFHRNASAWVAPILKKSGDSALVGGVRMSF